MVIKEADLYQSVEREAAKLQYLSIHTDLDAIKVVRRSCIPERGIISRRHTRGDLKNIATRTSRLPCRCSLIRRGQRTLKIVIQLEPTESGQHGYPAGESEPPVDFGTIKIRRGTPCHCLVWKILSLPEDAGSPHHQPVCWTVGANGFGGALVEDIEI